MAPKDQRRSRLRVVHFNEWVKIINFRAEFEGTADGPRRHDPHSRLLRETQQRLVRKFELGHDVSREWAQIRQHFLNLDYFRDMQAYIRMRMLADERSRCGTAASSSAAPPLPPVSEPPAYVWAPLPPPPLDTADQEEYF